MTKLPMPGWICALLVSGALTLIAGCGNEDDEGSPGGPPDSESLAGFTLDCEGQSQQQQQQAQFQKQEGCSPAQEQKLVFKEGKVADFEVELDCDNRRVIVSYQGEDPERRTLGFGADGRIRGELEFLRQLQNDGKGNELCWIKHIVSFDGVAECGTVADESGARAQSLDLKTTVDFEATDEQSLEQAGIADPEASPSPSSSPTSTPEDSPSPDDSPSPSPSPSPSVSPSPSPSPSPTMTGTPSPAPTATVTPIKICLVDAVCPIEADTKLSCGE